MVVQTQVPNFTCARNFRDGLLVDLKPQRKGLLQTPSYVKVPKNPQGSIHVTLARSIPEMFCFFK